MTILLRMVGVLVLGFFAMGLIAWGWGFWLAWAMYIGEEHGPTWRWVAVVAMATVNVAAAVLLYRLHDRLARNLDFRLGRRAPRDRLFCRRCGTPAPADQVLCAVCGGTQFGLSHHGSLTAEPARSSRTSRIAAEP
jgi:hypothetical protein